MARLVRLVGRLFKLMSWAMWFRTSMFSNRVIILVRDQLWYSLRVACEPSTKRDLRREEVPIMMIDVAG